MAEEASKPKIFDRSLDSIHRGREGLNSGIPIPFTRLRKYLPNIQKGTYYLIGAGTKVGKTSFVDDLFAYGAYDYIKSNPESEITLDIDYLSFEINAENKILKGVTRKLWHDYGIIADVNTILSRGDNWCSDELYNLVLSYREYFNEMEDIIHIQDMPENPTGVNKYLYKKAEQHGTKYEKIVGKTAEGRDIKKFSHYEPHNPNRYWIIIIDHIALMPEERGYTTKQNIDKMSQYFVTLRNRFNAIPVVIQQMAFDSESDERFKSQRLTPTLKDFGDSKYTTRDANVIMALFAPGRYKLERFQGYNTMKLKNTYRNLEILENRDGEPNVNVGLNFIGPAGTFRELPKASDMTNAGYEYAEQMLNNRSTYVQENGVWKPRI